MRSKERLAVWLGSAALATIATASVAEAGGFAIREQSAYGQGTSFAGVAAGGSLSSMFWNPATLAGVSVFEVEGVISGVFPSADVDVLGPESLTVPPIPFPIPTGRRRARATSSRTRRCPPSMPPTVCRTDSCSASASTARSG